MKKRLIIFLAMNVWGLSGCKPSRSNNIGVFEPRTTLDEGATVEQKGSATHSAATDNAAQTRGVKGKVNPSVWAAKDSQPAEMRVANAFANDPYLFSKVKPLLPPHSTVAGAATGFKNQKQFIAAMHLSKNLHIPFDQIKTRMTGEHGMSLQDALRDLRPKMTKNDLKGQVNKAEKQAKEDESQAKDQAKKASTQDKLATK